MWHSLALTIRLNCLHYTYGLHHLILVTQWRPPHEGKAEFGRSEPWWTITESVGQKPSKAGEEDMWLMRWNCTGEGWRGLLRRPCKEGLRVDGESPLLVVLSLLTTSSFLSGDGPGVGCCTLLADTAIVSIASLVLDSAFACVGFGELLVATGLLFGERRYDLGCCRCWYPWTGYAPMHREITQSSPGQHYPA